MLTDLKTLLRQAQKGKTAVGAFNVYNLETIMAVIRAAENTGSPAIISFGEGYFNHMPIEAIAESVKILCKDINIPIVLHLDHAKELSSIMAAIRAGFTSVMYDGTTLSLDENIKNTKKIVEIAHAVGVSVEGELGYLNPEDGNQEDNIDIEDGNTRPEEAERFAKETGVDALAIAIGNAHGLYKGTPELDFVRLEKINQVVDIPLVLHGCSGIPDNMLQKAVSLGVCKINVNTEISTSAVRNARDYLMENQQKGLKFEKVLMEARKEMIKTIEKYIILLRTGELR